MEPVKVETIPGHSLLPSSSRIAKGDMAMFDAMSNIGPMDISDDGADAFSKVLYKDQVEDIDSEDAGNPQLVSLYVNNIYSYMWQLEVCFCNLNNFQLNTHVDHFKNFYHWFFNVLQT